MAKELKIYRGDITTIEVDAIVNAANKSLLGGGGVDGAIHRAAGPELLEETKKLGGAETGEVKITKGYDLPAKYVLHAVGPVYKDGTKNEAELLASCYRNALKLADEYNLQSVAFSAISTGVYGYPIEEATDIAVSAVLQDLSDLSSVNEIIFVVFDQKTEKIYEEAFRNHQINIK